MHSAINMFLLDDRIVSIVVSSRNAVTNLTSRRHRHVRELVWSPIQTDQESDKAS